MRFNPSVTHPPAETPDGPPTSAAGQRRAPSTVFTVMVVLGVLAAGQLFLAVVTAGSGSLTPYAHLAVAGTAVGLALLMHRGRRLGRVLVVVLAFLLLAVALAGAVVGNVVTAFLLAVWPAVILALLATPSARAWFRRPAPSG